MAAVEGKKNLLSILWSIMGRKRDNRQMEKPEAVEVHLLEEKQSKNRCQSVKSCFIKDGIMFLTIASIVVGFGLGFGLRELSLSKDALMWIGMPGELFLRTLRMMILPLIVCSVISGTASLDPKCNCKMAGVAFLYIVSSNAIACLLAIGLVQLIKPGQVNAGTKGDVTREMLQTQDIFADMLRNIVPDNLVEASFRQSQTQYIVTENEVVRNFTNGSSTLESISTITKTLGTSDSINILGLITACTMMGMAASSLKNKMRVFIPFFEEATDIVLLIIRKFFWVAPFGICSLVVVSIAGVRDLGETFSQLGLFVLTVSLGVFVHSFITLPAILFLVTRRNPYVFLLTIVRPCMIGFASTITAVAIPEMIESCEVKNKIDSRVVRSVVPFTVTLNADGSALYITCAAFFIARLSGETITAGDVIIIGILTTIASLAIPSVPSASLVTLVIILTSVNVSAHHIGLLFAVEWYLDRIRTACNVISHTVSVAVTYQFCKKNLEELDKATEKEKALEDAQCTELTSIA